jgi:hypothetical protein
MTEPYDAHADPDPAAAVEALPTLISVNTSFANRLPSQRVLDLLGRIEGVEFGELAQTQPSRLLAFRALMRDYPERDPTSLWLHAYDVEVALLDANPTNGQSPTVALGSAATGA